MIDASPLLWWIASLFAVPIGTAFALVMLLRTRPNATLEEAARALAAALRARRRPKG